MWKIILSLSFVATNGITLKRVGGQQNQHAAAWAGLKNELTLRTTSQLTQAWVYVLLSATEADTGNESARLQITMQIATVDEGQWLTSIICEAVGGFQGDSAGQSHCYKYGYTAGICALDNANPALASCEKQGASPFDEMWEYTGDADQDVATTLRFQKGKFILVGKSTASGDPHVINLEGERFDILKAGARVMVQYPQESTFYDASLLVVADIVRADAKWCENTFIESVHARGKDIGASVSFTMGKLRSPRPFRVQVDADQFATLGEVTKQAIALASGSSIHATGKTMTLTTAKAVRINVSLVSHSHFQFFNLEVSGLSVLTGDVGGLLGMDDHSEEAHVDCKWKTHKDALLQGSLQDRWSRLRATA